MIAHADEQIVRDHSRFLRAYARRQVRDPHLAEDLVQDTLVAALTAGDRFEGRSAMRTWLVGILRHKILDAFRSRARDPAGYEHIDKVAAGEGENDAGLPATGEQADENDPEALEARRRFWEAAQAHLDRMPARAARAFMMAEVLGHDAADVCRELGMTDASLWTTLHRTRKRLRAALQSARPN